MYGGIALHQHIILQLELFFQFSNYGSQLPLILQYIDFRLVRYRLKNLTIRGGFGNILIIDLVHQVSLFIVICPSGLEFHTPDSTIQTWLFDHFDTFRFRRVDTKFGQSRF